MANWNATQHSPASAIPHASECRHHPAPAATPATANWQGLRLGILTLSDSRTQANDQSGAALQQLAEEWHGRVEVRTLIADNQHEIAETLRAWSDQLQLDLILTTGGTGPGPRDVTPEATRAVCNRELPGFAEQIRAAGLQQTRNALFTRGITALRGTTLIVNLPGSTRGASHSLRAIADLVPHALRMARGGGHHPPATHG
ncbi:MAG: MogA/MoaB family molybdenum cofactor biosynthesis protein [Magnetococcales bacterium]|nr:MogA/MoaB family molybdenum cofactor biosynthesis protein [Magnetococcales bacterium]MBF0114370.1 MogA/MoaB family molybdenum cofactor biosynthesis protein [Magnetococcales bacterium]